LNRVIQAVDNKKKKHKDALLKYDWALREQEISLFKVVAAMDARGDVFDTSTMKESLKNKLTSMEEKIKELKIKLLEKQAKKHLGCQSEIQELKSQIHYLKNKPITLTLPILQISYQ